jgi:hypothetical protein
VSVQLLKSAAKKLYALPTSTLFLSEFILCLRVPSGSALSETLVVGVKELILHGRTYYAVGSRHGAAQEFVYAWKQKWYHRVTTATVDQQPFVTIGDRTGPRLTHD